MIGLMQFLGLYVLANVVAFALFGLDKLAAKMDWRRIPETNLLSLASLGWPGAKFGQRLFRHKTRKQPFANRLNLALGAHALFILAGIGWALGWIEL